MMTSCRFVRLSRICCFAELSLQEWSGLGFVNPKTIGVIITQSCAQYRRGSMLLEAVKHVCETRKGVIPNTAEELGKLRGVGPYTAGAIASIAFGQKSAIVDGNVVRVLSRVRALGGSPQLAVNTKQVWSLSKALVEASTDPGTWKGRMLVCVCVVVICMHRIAQSSSDGSGRHGMHQSKSKL